VDGKRVIIIDDMIATAGSLKEAATALKNSGAREIYAAATHAVFAGPAIERIQESPLEAVFVTDTIALPPAKQHPKVKVLSVAKLLGEAIRRIHNEESVNSLFI